MQWVLENKILLISTQWYYKATFPVNKRMLNVSNNKWILLLGKTIEFQWCKYITSHTEYPHFHPHLVPTCTNYASLCLKRLLDICMPGCWCSAFGRSLWRWGLWGNRLQRLSSQWGVIVLQTAAAMEAGGLSTSSVWTVQLFFPSCAHANSDFK